jgi:hypothetical protein
MIKKRHSGHFYSHDRAACQKECVIRGKQGKPVWDFKLICIYCELNKEEIIKPY